MYPQGFPGYRYSVPAVSTDVTTSSQFTRQGVQSRVSQVPVDPQLGGGRAFFPQPGFSARQQYSMNPHMQGHYEVSRTHEVRRERWVQSAQGGLRMPVSGGGYYPCQSSFAYGVESQYPGQQSPVRAGIPQTVRATSATRAEPAMTHLVCQLHPWQEDILQRDFNGVFFGQIPGLLRQRAYEIGVPYTNCVNYFRDRLAITEMWQPQGVSQSAYPATATSQQVSFAAHTGSGYQSRTTQKGRKSAGRKRKAQEAPIVPVSPPKIAAAGSVRHTLPNFAFSFLRDRATGERAISVSAPDQSSESRPLPPAIPISVAITSSCSGATQLPSQTAQSIVTATATFSEGRQIAHPLQSPDRWFERSHSYTYGQQSRDPLRNPHQEQTSSEQSKALTDVNIVAGPAQIESSAVNTVSSGTVTSALVGNVRSSSLARSLSDPSGTGISTPLEHLAAVATNVLEQFSMPSPVVTGERISWKKKRLPEFTGQSSTLQRMPHDDQPSSASRGAQDDSPASSTVATPASGLLFTGSKMRESSGEGRSTPQETQTLTIKPDDVLDIVQSAIASSQLDLGTAQAAETDSERSLD